MKVEYDISQGKEVDVKVFKEITNYTADLNLNKVYALLDAKKFDEAVVILDDIINAKENVSKTVYIRAKAQKVYIHLINDDIEAAATYYDKEVPVSERRDISDDNSMACVRAYILMEGLLDKSRSETIIALNKVNSAYKKTPANRKAVERQLFNDALKKVNEAHPKWELDKYYLPEEELNEKKKKTILCYWLSSSSWSTPSVSTAPALDGSFSDFPNNTVEASSSCRFLNGATNA